MKEITLIILAILNIYPIFTQNLLQNPSFETHGNIDCLSCHLRSDNFAAMIKPWRNMNSYETVICDCTYKKSSQEQISIGCQFDKVKPHTGNTMIEMSYAENCIDWQHDTKGCASYIATTLEKTLETGKIYELSFWINILYADEPEYLKHIGVLFFPKMFGNPNGAMLEGTPFVLDTIIMNQWYKVRWAIKPTCDLKCFAIGVFRDKTGPPIYSSFDVDNIYYIDDLELKEVKEKTNEPVLSPTLFCKYEELSTTAKSVDIESVLLYFESGDSLLSLEEYQKLDSFAFQLKGHPETVFSISGHTDDIGSAHAALSKARVKESLDYLNKKHKIAPFRFIPLYFGNEKPIADNSTEIGRKQNRRVEIRQLNFVLQDVVYRNLMNAVFDNNLGLAYQYLEKWLIIADQSEKILMQNDPRIDVLKKSKQWQSIVEKVRKSYKTFAKPALAYSLDSLWIEDQRGRTLEKYIENLQSYLPEVDGGDKRWDVFFPFDTGAIYETNSRNHLNAMVKIIDKHAWPKTSEVGKRAAKAAFLAYAHCTDTIQLKKVIPILEKTCKEGEAEWIYYATILDNCLILQKKPQKYGTQYKIDPKDEDKQELLPLENRELVNEYRAKIGLSPLIKF
jgi:outer membrane protein OmpA-like peptidoglycan-associated protein